MSHTTFTTIYSRKSSGAAEAYKCPVLSATMIKWIMHMATTSMHRVPRSMIPSSTARALDKHGLLKAWYLHIEHVEKNPKLTYKKSDLDDHVPDDPGERLVRTWSLSDEGRRVAATVDHLRHLRRVMASFGVTRWSSWDAREHKVRTDQPGSEHLTHEQYNLLHGLQSAIQDLDPDGLTAEPVGALADQVITNKEATTP